MGQKSAARLLFVLLAGLLDLDDMQRRIVGYVERQVGLGKLSSEGCYLLREVFLRGKVPRGEAARITGRPERTARRILKQLLDQRLLTAESEKGP